MSPRDGLHSLPACDLDADAAAQAEALRAGVAALLGVDRERVAVVLCASPAVDDCPATWTASADVGPSSWTSSGATPAAACAALLDFVGLCAAASREGAMTPADRATGGDHYQGARLAGVCPACGGRGRRLYARDVEDGCDECDATGRTPLTAVDRATGGDPYQAARLASWGG